MKLVDLIRKDIAENNIVQDGKIPPMRTLAARYNCGTTSVKRAFDILEKDGIIRVIKGKGNFVIDSKNSSARKKAKIIGAILLNGAFESELAAIRDDYLQKGWLFSIYNAYSDHQSPEKEKLFLQNAESQNFSSFIITASPLEPVNKELFLKLRADGCKVIHISPYVDDMADECYFLADYEQAASLAVWKIAVAGYKNILYIGREYTAPHIKKTDNGVFNTVKDSGLNTIGHFTVHHKETDMIIEYLKKLPPDTAILAFDTEIGEIVQWCAARLGLSVPQDFGLVSVINIFGVNASHSHTAVNISQIVQDVLDYAIDEKRSPFEKIQKLYRSEFTDKGTL